MAKKPPPFPPAKGGKKAPPPFGKPPGGKMPKKPCK